MDDIFSDSKNDDAKEGDSNIEWKKSGIDKHERLTLKTNVREANLYNAGKPNDLKSKPKVRTPLEVPKGFKKVSRKIRDAMDEEEDEDDYILIPVFEDVRESSLMRALTDDEKKILRQNENLNAIRLQENIGKEAAIAQAERVIMQAGLGKADARVLDEQRLKAGRVSVQEVVAEAAKQKAPSKVSAKSRNENKPPRRDEAKARAAAKEIARSNDKEAKEAARKLKEAQLKAEQKLREEKAVKDVRQPQQTEQDRLREAEAAQAAALEAKVAAEQKTEEKTPPPAEAQTLPQNVKETEAIKEEKLSIKEDEKAPAERPQPEVSSVKEEKTDQKAKPEVEKDQVNKDRINQKEESGKPETEIKPKTEPETVKEQPKNEEAVKQTAKEIVKEVEQKPQPQRESKTEKEKEIKELIMEKSGRTYNDRYPKKEIDKSQLSEKEYQKMLEAQVKMYQDRER